MALTLPTNKVKLFKILARVTLHPLCQLIKYIFNFEMFYYFKQIKCNKHMMLMNAMHDFGFLNLNNKKFLIPLNFQIFEILGMLHTTTLKRNLVPEIRRG